MEVVCRACKGDKICKNIHHDGIVPGLLDQVAGAYDPCPACGGPTWERGKCSGCGGTGWQEVEKPRESFDDSEDSVELSPETEGCLRIFAGIVFIIMALVSAIYLPFQVKDDPSQGPLVMQIIAVIAAPIICGIVGWKLIKHGGQ